MFVFNYSLHINFTNTNVLGVERRPRRRFAFQKWYLRVARKDFSPWGRQAVEGFLLGIARSSSRSLASREERWEIPSDACNKLAQGCDGACPLHGWEIGSTVGHCGKGKMLHNYGDPIFLFKSSVYSDAYVRIELATPREIFDDAY